jgi:hypothetical protein
VAEVEIHTGHGHPADPQGQRVGVLVGVIGVVLAVVTIASHREHTTAVIERTEANDQWGFYQAKKSKAHLQEMGATLLHVLGPTAPGAEQAIDTFKKESERYDRDAEEIQHKATELEAATERAEHKALRFDLGEGFLELGLVLSSLYFLSHRRLYPILGLGAATFGGVVAILGAVG